MIDDTSSVAEPDDLSLTDPDGLYVLRERAIPGGRVTVSGYAVFQGVRVHVTGASSHGLVSIVGELPAHRVQYRHDDPQLGVSFGEVDFGWLSRFWLTRTSTFDVIDEHTPAPGLLARLDGVDVGVSDTCGTVSLTGVPQLQAVCLGETAPVDDGWQPDGYGSLTKLIDRSRINTVQHVEWTAIWRDITVTVADIRDGEALVFVSRGGVPEFEAPEIVHGANLRSGWSAVVPLDQLSLRGWTSTERPLGLGCAEGFVGLVRGRYARVGRTAIKGAPGTPDTAGPGLVAQKLRGQTVTADYALFARTGRTDSSWEWRMDIDPADLTDVRQITATTVWQGQTRAVAGFYAEEGVVYFERDTVDQRDVAPLVFAASVVDPAVLPSVDTLI